MINEKMLNLGQKRSTIRELFEYGRLLREERGDNAVFDFSLGNPSVPSPIEVTEGLRALIDNIPPSDLHSYTSAEGDANVRRAIAEYIRFSYGARADEGLIYITTGAAGGLAAAITALATEGESVAVLSPFFPEYRVFIERCGATLKKIDCRTDNFRPDFDAIEKGIDETVAAIIINSPNNPTGAVYTEDDIKKIAAILKKKSVEFGKKIYIIADEPYRELVYDGASVPFIPNYYDDTVVCYSYSKSLSIPGERIGYLFVSPTADNAKSLFRAICGAARALGYVCAPNLFQRLIPICLGKTSDIEIYDKNRKALLSALKEYGYEVTHPSGAFYLFIKSPIPDAKEFSDIAKERGILLVPSDDFGCEGFLRLAYCQNPEMIERSLPIFKKLAEDVKTKKTET